MSEKNYQSPDGPGLMMDDFHPSTEFRGYGAHSPPQNKHYGARLKSDANHKGNQMRLSGGIVGHQQYGNWQEHNQLYQKGNAVGQGEMMGGMYPHMKPGNHSAHAGNRKKRPQSSNQMRQKKSSKARHARKEQEMWMAQSHASNWSPGRIHSQMMMPQMMAPPMQAFGPGPIMPPAFDTMGASLTPIGHFGAQPFPTLSDAGGMTSATTRQESAYEETERKNKAKIELLEKKIRAKDQLFEDALASTVASSGFGVSTQIENKSLTAELKKRYLKLKARYTEAEQEISRLTKTVKVVEIEVREDTEPLRDEIQKLQNEKFDLTQTNARQTEQITDQRLKIEEMERERSQRMIDGERSRGEQQLLQERIRSLEEELKFKISEIELAQTEIRDFREAHSNFEIQISRLQSELSEASLYKEWYESKQNEYDGLVTQLEAEQRKLYEKEDEIMALNDKVTERDETIVELRETISEHTKQIKELEDELAKRPEIKDDSSSSSEKPDYSAEMEEWKRKHDEISSEFEKYKMQAESEIKELTTSVTNLEKRNVELKLMLRKNNINLDGSPQKVSATEVIQTEVNVTQTNQVVNQVVNTTQETVVEQTEVQKSKKVKKIKEEDSDDEEASESEQDRHRKRSRKHKKRRRRSYSSSSYSDRSRSRRSHRRSHSRGEQSVRFDRAEQSFFQGDQTGAGGAAQHQASLLMTKSEAQIITGDNERAQELEQEVRDARLTVETKDSEIQQYMITIEELRQEILVHERKAEEEARSNSLIGKMQGAVNNAMYKKKYEDVQKRWTLEKEEFNLQIKQEKEKLVEKEMELITLVQTNQKNINTFKQESVTQGEPIFHRIELQQAQIEVREKKIFLDKTVIEASDQAKVTVLDRERKQIKAQFLKRFKKQIQELEANVLAYQDLLLTKEVMIKRMEKELLESQIENKHAHLVAEITNLKKILEEKLTIIEELRAKGGDWCLDHDSDDELTQGTCTRAKLKRRVFKKIEQVNEYIRNEVTPEIHEKYHIEIQALKENHLDEIEHMQKNQKIELYNHAQSYEIKIREWAAETKKYQDINANLEENLKEKVSKIKDLDLLGEEQAARLAELMTEIKKQKTLHEGQMKREEEKHNSEIQELKKTHTFNFSQVQIDKQNIEELYEELKKVTFQSTDENSKIDIIRRECDELKIQIARLLKTEQQLVEELHQKDKQIQLGLDYRKQWNYAKFEKLEESVAFLEKEKAALKAKYKHKVIVKTETIKAELSKELVKVRDELERRTDLLQRREEELEPLYTRVEELEMMQSSQSLEVKDIHERYKVLISQLKSENANMHKKYLTKIETTQFGLQKETLRVEKAYLDKIEWYKTNEKAIREEEEIKADSRIKKIEETHNAEINRLNVIINLYKEKLTRREGENRNILVELKIYKDKVETIRQDFIDEIAALKAELEQKRKELLNQQREHQAIVLSLEQSLQMKQVEIDELTVKSIEQDQTIIELRNINQQLSMQVEQLKLKIQQLEQMIEQLRSQIIELQSRQIEPVIVEREKIVEKIVYRDREVQPQAPDSDKDIEVSEHESQEETFEIVGRVKIGEASGTFAALEREDD